MSSVVSKSFGDNFAVDAQDPLMLVPQHVGEHLP